MTYNTGNVPFRITDIDLDFQEANGVIRLAGRRLILEYQVRDALGLSVRSEKRELHLPIEELKELEMKDLWLILRLNIRVRSAWKVRGLPKTESGELRLKVARKHRKALTDFVFATRLLLSETRAGNPEF